MSARKVLVVSYYFPPISNIGAQRIIKFAKYLPSFGYETAVLTVGPGPSEEHVFRARDPLLWYRPYADRVFGRARFESLSAKGKSFKQAASYFVARRLLVPEPQIGWLPFAAATAGAAVRVEQPDIIFTSSPPLTPHFVGWWAAARTGIPWVADFRDGWMLDPHPPRPQNAVLRMAIERRLEKGVVTKADAITTATDPLTDDLRERFPVRAPFINTITNGYDEEDYASGEIRPDPALFHIVHTGGFASSKSTRTPKYFLLALRRFADRLTPHERSKIRVTFAGRLTSDEEELIQADGMSALVRYVGQLPATDVVRLQRSATVLLLVTTPNERSEATGKLFEYFGARRPILALAEGNAAASCVEATQTGVCAPPADVDAIANRLGGLFVRFTAGSLEEPLPPTKVAQYSRRHLTGELSRVFDDVLRRRAGR